MKRSLFGYGGTIKAIAKNCLEEGIWDIYDDKFSQISKDEFGNNLLPVSEFNPDESVLEIPSPGIPPYHELIQKSQNLISEYDFFASKMPFNVWISGTNGKTTTTKMMQHLLESKGSVMGGNVGVALGDLDPKTKIWILETSSFTMHYTKIAKPDIYVLLPISPDHLAWHGDMRSYEAAKLKPLGMMRENSVAILPEIYANTPTLAKVISYKNQEDLAKFCGVEISEINFKVPFLIDALLALAVERIVFDSCNVNLLNKFVIENNKLEEFTDKFARIWVNDTKATNIDATIQALKRYEDKFIHLILGGDDKGVDMTPLFEVINAKNTKIYAIGSNGDKLMKLADKFKIPALKCEFLDIAVAQIDKNFKKQDVKANLSDEISNEIALLSPAAASLDQFNSYAERGDKFKEFVLNL